jgi:hypothetical protein
MPERDIPIEYDEVSSFDTSIKMFSATLQKVNPPGWGRGDWNPD